ncbi:MAG: ShlB/FhaC/HecB family hemolysin secretion/activation protein, partial [Stellaceae bacterium]
MRSANNRRIAAFFLVGLLLMSLSQLTRAQAPPPPTPSPLPRLPEIIPPLTSPIPGVLPPEQPEIVPPAPPSVEAAPPPSGPPVRVDEIRIEGVTVYDQATLRSLYAAAVGLAVPRARLDQVVQDLQTRYREDGYILTVVRGEFQRVGARVVFVIRAIEGYIADVKLEGDIGPAATLVYEFLQNLTAKRPINNSDLERWLLLAGDIPGLQVRAVLRRQSGEPGAIELVAQLARKPVSGLVNYDNRGPQDVGPNEILISGATNSFTSLGERLEAIFFNTFNREELFGQVDGDAFLGASGMRLRGYFGRGNTQPGGVFAPIGFNGDLTIGGGALSYPIIRSRRLNLYVDSDVDAYESTVSLSPVTETPGSGSHLVILRVGGALDYQDTFFAGVPAASSTNLKVSRGLAATSNTRPGNQVDFSKVTGEYTRVQNLFTIGMVGTAIKGSVGGQFTNDILPPSEKFFLGGVRYGRGFFYGQVTGDRAIGSTLELQLNTGFTQVPLLPPDYRLDTQFYGFWDYGRGYNLAP